MHYLLLFFLIVPIGLSGGALGQEAQSFKEPLREVSVILTNEGYYPNRLVVNKGERLRIFVTSTLEDPNCLVVDEHNIFVAATKGKMTEAEAVFHRAGRFKFYCPSAKFEGFVTVIEKGLQKQKQENEIYAPSEAKRELASDYDNPKLWKPKEY